MGPLIQRMCHRAAAALLALILAPACYAAGFGDVRVLSALNEPLRADIPLLDSSGLQADQIEVRLADTRTLQQMGIEEQAVPGDIEISVDLGPEEPRVLVRSRGAVTEPYVALVLELRVPDGQVLKEFTLLLDPPRAAKPVEDEPNFDVASGSAPRTPDSAPASSTAEAAGGWYQMGAEPETLWRIATNHRPGQGVTTQQTMLAILRLNPAAFIEGNINRLKASQRLRLPSAEQATALSAAEAQEAVQKHAVAWNGRAASPSAGSSSSGEDPSAVLPPTEAPTAEDIAPSTESVPESLEAKPEGSDASDLPAENKASATVEQGEGRLDIVADPLTLQTENDRLVAEVEVLRNELAAAREEGAAALKSRDREIGALTAQVERLKQAARRSEAQTESREPDGRPLSANSSLLVAVLSLLVGMGLAGGWFWWRGGFGGAAPKAELTPLPPTQPIAAAVTYISTAMPTATATATAIGERAATAPSLPAVSDYPPLRTDTDARPLRTDADGPRFPPHQDRSANLLTAADLRLEADDIDALDADTLALEMDMPPSAGGGASAPSEQGPSLAGAEFEFLDDLDSAATKLDLARAYREMGDSEGAREILKEVLAEGNAEQQQVARELLAAL